MSTINKGFLTVNRKTPASEQPENRVQHFKEFVPLGASELQHEQSSRCMDCGVPFCHSGCPIGNNIPEFNAAVHEGKWQEAYNILSQTNNFPEFTGRICPAPCEGSCVLGINSDPVAIEFIEKSIVEQAFASGWIEPRIPENRTGKTIAVIGSGPAGLTTADELNQAGHTVTVYEKADRIGGLLRYGIPDFKLQKDVVQRRVDLLEAEGISFKMNTALGKDVHLNELSENYDAVVLCIGAEVPRDLPIPGRELKGIDFAMHFLTTNNKQVANPSKELPSILELTGKTVVVIGGGDTGSDCIGTSNRRGAANVVQLELLSKPPLSRAADNPWPLWPLVYRSSSSHEEGCEREFSVLTKSFESEDGQHVSALNLVKVEWNKDEQGKYSMVEVPGSEERIACDQVFLAIGFLNPETKTWAAQTGVELNERSNIKTTNYQTDVENVFAAGDARRGQSLVVWAIKEGQEAAKQVNVYLGQSKASAKLRSNPSMYAC